MPSRRSRNLLSRRRRRAEDDDEEGSITGDVADDSLSEGSGISNDEDDADVEGSEASDQEVGREGDSTANSRAANGHAPDTAHPISEHPKRATNGVFKPSPDTEAMMNGIKKLGVSGAVEELMFEETLAGSGASKDGQAEAQDQQKAGRQESLAERSRREHRQYLKQRDENPAFVPNRGGFFLHDNRTASPGLSCFRPFPRGRGRGPYNEMVSG